MKKHLNAKEFSSLIDYYIDCLCQEQLLTIIFPRSSEGKQFLSNVFPQDPFFTKKNHEITIPITSELEQFLQSYKKTSSQNKLFYGYPVFYDSDHNLCPLITIELSWKQQGPTIQFTQESHEPQFNSGFLIKYGYELEEIKEIRTLFNPNDLKETLQKLNDLLAIPIASSQSQDQVLQQKPKILSNGIIFFVGKTGFTQSLLIELHNLKNQPFPDCETSSLNLLLSPFDTQEKPISNLTSFLEIYALNPAQEQAVNHALTQPFTVITGPPGTGKSQVVLNIIANAVYSGKSVLFASKNNKAVDVVAEKIKPLLSVPAIMRMGAEQHRQQTKTTIPLLFKHNLELSDSKEQDRIEHEFREITKTIEKLQNQLHQMTTLNQTIDTIQSKIDNLRQQIPAELYTLGCRQLLQTIDYPYFKKTINQLYNPTHKRWIQLIHTLFPTHIHHKQYRFFKETCEKLSLELQQQIQLELKKNTVTYSVVLNWIDLVSQTISYQQEIKKIQHHLLSFPTVEMLRKKINELQQKKIHHSRFLFNQHWCKKIYSTTPEEKTAVQHFFDATCSPQGVVDDSMTWKKRDLLLKKTMHQILPFLPVWITTNLSAKNSVPLKNSLFDLVIIDEASQCDIISALPLLFRAKQAVIIGDPQQLRHIALLQDSLDKKLTFQHHIDYLHKDYSYVKSSLYDLAETITLARHDPPILLNEHYRCHRDIITFSNEYFYGKKLAVLTNEANLITTKYGEHGVFWYDTPGKTIRSHSSYNLEEIESVVRLIQKIQQTKDLHQASLGVVTLFRAQMELIEEKIKGCTDLQKIPITVGTAHRFQGDEKDIIIFSPAVSHEIYPGTLHWIEATRQLLNVAISRAKSLLFIVGDQTTCRNIHGVLQELAMYVETCQHRTSDFSSDAERLFYEIVTDHGLRILPHHRIQDHTHTIHDADFVLFTGNQKYVIWIDDDESRYTKDAFLRNDGWHIRHYSTQDIYNHLPEILESVKRLC